MPASCSVRGCFNRYGAEGQLQFFSFPLKNQEILQLWVKAIGRANFVPTKWSRLCSAHFTEEDYLVRPGIYIRRLKPTAVPSIFPAPSTYKRKGGRPAKILRSPNRVEAPCPLSKKKYFNELTSNEQAPSVDLSRTREVSPSKEHVPLFDLSSTLEVLSTKTPCSDPEEDPLEVLSTNAQTPCSDPEEDLFPKEKPLEVLLLNVRTPTNDLPVTQLVQTNEQYVQTIGNDKEVISKLRHQVKILQQKLRRRDTSMCKVKELLRDLKKRGIIKGSAEYFEDI